MIPQATKKSHQKPARSAVLSVITGGGKWIEVTTYADPLYQHLIVTASTHILCWSCGVYFCIAASSENDQGSMNLASNTASLLCTGHPAWPPSGAGPDDIDKDLSGIGLVPAPIELLGHHPELDEEIAGQVLRLDLAALFPPKPEKRLLIIAHYDPGVRAADEIATSGLATFKGLFTLHFLLRICDAIPFSFLGRMVATSDFFRSEAIELSRLRKRTCSVTGQRRARQQAGPDRLVEIDLSEKQTPIGASLTCPLAPAGRPIHAGLERGARHAETALPR